MADDPRPPPRLAAGLFDRNLLVDQREVDALAGPDEVRHLTAVRAHLVAGGLYVVELAHPADFFAADPRTSSEWTIDADGVHAAGDGSGGFELVATYGDFDETTALESPTAWRMILILRHAA